ANDHEPSITVRPAASSGPTAVVVSYTRDGTGTTRDVFLRRLDLALGFAGGEQQANTTAGVASQSSVAIDASLNFVVAWTDATHPPATAIKMRRFSGAGVAATAGEEVADNSAGNKSHPDVAKASDDGRFIIAYVDAGGSTSRVVFSEFTPAGKLQSTKRFF